jgi:AcrR family transcriptional regulator
MLPRGDLAVPYPSKIDARRVLDAAVARVEAAGPEALSLRGLAAELGVAPNALYRYYPDREALLAALGNEAAARLLAALRAAAADRDPADAVRRMAEAYLAFARSSPALYAAFLGKEAYPETYRGAHHALWDLVVAVFGRLVGEDRATDAALACWAFLHGLAGLAGAGLAGAPTAAAAAAFGLDAMLTQAERTAEHGPTQSDGRTAGPIVGP